MPLLARAPGAIMRVFFLMVGLSVHGGLSVASADVIKLGAGHYTTHLRAGGEREPAALKPRYGMKNAPVPTNQWYSSLLFDTWPQTLFPLPVSLRATVKGLEVDVPRPEAMLNGQREEYDVQAGHRVSLVIELPFAIKNAQAGKASRWAVDLVMGDGVDKLTGTLAHGSPYSQFQVSSNEVTFRAKKSLRIFHRSADGRALGILAKGKQFGLFAPQGAQWETFSSEKDNGKELSIRLRLPEGRNFFSLSALPDRSIETFELFHRHAYAFITDTRVEWSFDEKRSELTTMFSLTTEPMEGEERDTLMGLFPHQWFQNPAQPELTGIEFKTIRGPLKIFAGNEFQTRYSYQGILPFWPGLEDNQAREKLEEFLTRDTRFGGEFLLGNRGTYWQGKGFNRALQVMSIAEQHSDLKVRDEILAALKARLELWFAPEPNAEHYFHYNEEVGTVIGYPDEFGTAEELNDHHFHYGYWINAAAQIALRDPDWAKQEQWGGMVELLIADIANADPEDQRFPVLRHFDPYEGHSWASGLAGFYDGNNQESSSEAVHAWAGLILWGEITGNKIIRDTGIYLYTTEVASLSHYWFDLYDLVFHPAYSHEDATIVWGGKYGHSTWWTEDPRQAHGINFLPLTGASTYLGRDREYLKRNFIAMDEEFEHYLARGKRSPKDIWQDILLQTYALGYPQEALAKWNEKGFVEDGETRTHSYYWMRSLVEMGRPDLTVSADTVLHGVFENSSGERTYIVYNAAENVRKVTFSDGVQLEAAPRALSEKTVNSQ